MLALMRECFSACAVCVHVGVQFRNFLLKAGRFASGLIFFRCLMLALMRECVSACAVCVHVGVQFRNFLLKAAWLFCFWLEFVSSFHAFFDALSVLSLGQVVES